MITSLEGQSPLITWISCKFTRLIIPNLIANHAWYKQDLIKKLQSRKSYKYQPKIYLPQRITVSILQKRVQKIQIMLYRKFFFSFGHWQIIFLLYETFFQTFFVFLHPRQPLRKSWQVKVDFDSTNFAHQIFILFF